MQSISLLNERTQSIGQLFRQWYQAALAPFYYREFESASAQNRYPSRAAEDIR